MTPKIRPIVWEGISLDIHKYLTNEYSDMSLASEELPAIQEWLNEKLQEVTEKKFIQKSLIDEAEAKAFFALKSGLYEERGYAGKATDKSVEKAVSLENDVKTAKREFAVLYGWQQRLYNLQLSLQAKLDLLRSAEATRRRVFDNTEAIMPHNRE